MTGAVTMADGHRRDTKLVRAGLKRSGFQETSEALFLNSGYVYDSAEEAAAAFAGEEVATLPTLGEVRDMMRRHAELLCQHMGEERGCKEFRKHVSWYLKGFAAGGTMRRSLGLVSTLADLDALLADLDPDEPFPVAELGTPRGRQGSPRDRVVLPEGWLDDADGSGCAVEEDLHSGG